MENIILPYILAGSVLALGCVLMLRKLYLHRDHLVWRTALIGAALVYVGFVLVSGALPHLITEVCGVVLYGAFAWLS